VEDPHLVINSKNMFGKARYTNTVHLGARHTHTINRSNMELRKTRKQSIPRRKINKTNRVYMYPVILR
jgi:hypothetical protein